jgi:hypothetical protein
MAHLGAFDIGERTHSIVYMRTYPWSTSVVLAVLETDNDKSIERVREARAAIRRRIQELDGPADPEELEALWQAATSIAALSEKQ